jgi:integrase
MTDTINKELLKESHNFLGTTVWIKEKPGGKFKYEVDLGRLYKTKLKGVYYDNKKVGRTKGFHTKVECIKYLKHLEELSKNVDTSITTDSKRDYINAREALDNAGHTKLSVADAIKTWLKHQPIISEQSVSGAWEEFMDYKKTVDQIDPVTVRSLKNNAYNSLKPFLDLPLTDFEMPECAGKLTAYVEKNWSNKTTRNHHFVKTSEFFNWCMTCQPQKLTKNPLANRRKLGKVKRKQPKIATVEQTEQILEVARSTDEELGMLAFWVITLFVGCRPESEVKRMTWDDIFIDDENDSYLMVAEESKTGYRRIDIKPQVREWLMLCNRKKPIFPANSRYAKDRRAILYSAGILKEEMTTAEKKEWQDFQRHTCASCMWRSGDFKWEKIIEQLGHSDSTSHAYYKNQKLSEADAKRFWQIRPSTIGEKIVKIA